MKISQQTRWAVVAGVLVYFTFVLFQKLDSVYRLSYEVALQLDVYRSKVAEQLHSTPKDSLRSPSGNLQDDIPMLAHNKSLGFGKIYYTSLPKRRDKQDAMELMASLTNMSIQLIYATNDSDISNEENGKYIVHVGSFRAHADMWKQMLRDEVETALFLEDDTDWDVHIHEQFEDLSRAIRDRRPDGPPFRRLNGTEWTEEEWQRAPYGWDWDVLQFGWCSNQLKTGNEDEPWLREFIHLYPDRTMPPKEWIGDNYGWRDSAQQVERALDVKGLGKGKWMEMQQKGLNSSGEWGPPVEGKPETQIPYPRLLAPHSGGTCLWSYSLTKRGAQRLLYHIGYASDLHWPVDTEYGALMGRGEVRGLMTVPGLFLDWKVGGFQDSDNDPGRFGTKERTAFDDGHSSGRGSGFRMSIREYAKSILDSHKLQPKRTGVKVLNYWEEVKEGMQNLYPEKVDGWNKEWADIEYKNKQKEEAEKRKKEDEERKKKEKEKEKEQKEKEQKEKEQKEKEQKEAKLKSEQEETAKKIQQEKQKLLDEIKKLEEADSDNKSEEPEEKKEEPKDSKV